MLVWVPHRETISCYRGLRMFAWAAAKRATGTRNGEQLT